MPTIYNSRPGLNSSILDSRYDWFLYLYPNTMSFSPILVPPAMFSSHFSAHRNKRVPFFPRCHVIHTFSGSWFCFVDWPTWIYYCGRLNVRKSLIFFCILRSKSIFYIHINKNHDNFDFLYGIMITGCKREGLLDWWRHIVHLFTKRRIGR